MKNKIELMERVLPLITKGKIKDMVCVSDNLPMPFFFWGILPIYTCLRMNATDSEII